jgi:hypothetical protein
MMRAKMRVRCVELLDDGSEHIRMSAVCKNEGYDTDGIDENNTYARFTPSADLSILVNNPVLVGKLQNGQEYYVDFTLAGEK